LHEPNFPEMNSSALLKSNREGVINLSIKTSCALTCALSNAQINNAFEHYCLRVIVRGNAIYKSNNKIFQVFENQFLLTNANQEGVGIVDSSNEVIQFCVHLTNDIVSNVYTNLTLDTCLGLDINKLLELHLFENVFSLNSQTSLARYLKPFIDTLKKGEQVHFNEESILNLAEKIICQELGIRDALTGLNKVKQSTRDEIMRRLLLGKEYMDAYFMDDPKISDVAKNALMAEYFFFKTFKQAFQITPYQYMLNRKIEFATELIKKNELNIGQIAESTGFPDIYTFSKAYKRKVGISPSMVVK
jgi:AraC family transcriptional regulator